MKYIIEAWAFVICQIEFLHLTDCKLGASASQYCARGIFSMPTLRTLVLQDVEFQDTFYETMSDEARNSKVQFILFWLQADSVMDMTGLD